MSDSANTVKTENPASTSMLKCLLGTPVALVGGYAALAAAVFLYRNEWVVIEALRVGIMATPTSLLGNGIMLFILCSIGGTILCIADKKESHFLAVFMLGALWSTPFMFVKAPEIFGAVSALEPYASSFALFMALVCGFGILVALGLAIGQTDDLLALCWFVCVVCMSAVACLVDWRDPSDVATKHGVGFSVTLFVGLVCQVVVLVLIARNGWKKSKWELSNEENVRKVLDREFGCF